MRFEPPRAFLASHSVAAAIAPELSFLRLYRHDGEAVLRDATALARDTDVCPAQALIASGEISAATYYKSLAGYLGLPFDDAWPVLAPLSDVAEAHRAGRVALSGVTGPRWLVAPTGETLRLLLRAKRLGAAMPKIAITTPDHLAALIEWRAQGEIEHAAREHLPEAAPRLSARDALAGRGGRIIAATLLALGLFACLAPRLTLDGLSLAFFAATAFRLFVCATREASLCAPELSDDRLPTFTVLVPLRGEAGMVAELLAALDALDYPRAKLQILILVEAEDHATQAALSACRLPACLRVVIAPHDRTLRTKPRALNIGLLAARGELVTVYDAEDRPAPDQLRRAAACFAIASADVACLQARLAIGNGDDGLLQRGIMEHPPQASDRLTA